MHFKEQIFAHLFLEHLAELREQDKPVHGHFALLDRIAVVLVGFVHVEKHGFHLFLHPQGSFLAVVGALFYLFAGKGGVSDTREHVNLLLLVRLLLHFAVLALLLPCN